MVGVIGQSKSLHKAAILEYLDGRVANTNRDVIPSAAWKLYVLPALAAGAMTTREMYSGIGTAYAGTSIYKQNLGSGTLINESLIAAADYMKKQPVKGRRAIVIVTDNEGLNYKSPDAEVVRAIREAGLDACAVPADVTREDCVRDALALAERAGPLRGVVHAYV